MKTGLKERYILLWVSHQGGKPDFLYIVDISPENQDDETHTIDTNHKQ